MNRVILNEEEFSQLSAEAVLLAKELISGEGDYIGNISRLNALRFEIGENDFDEDFKIFIAISSETDHMPFGQAKDNCSKNWLEQCDEELSKLKEFYREDIEKSCKSIIQRFSKNA